VFLQANRIGVKHNYPFLSQGKLPNKLTLPLNIYLCVRAHLEGIVCTKSKRFNRHQLRSPTTTLHVKKTGTRYFKSFGFECFFLCRLFKIILSEEF
jgi:hypothetical protein